jgi:muramidase (phage lysozyme)
MIEKMNSMLENQNVKTFLDFLAKAEGGDYNVVVGGSTFDDFSKHPGKVGLRTKEGPSTAAGRYQITKTTFDDVAPKLGLKDFSPRSQDLAAVYLLQRRGALEDVAGGNWDEAINKLGKEWASLPTSKYQQPKKTWEFVRENLPEKTAVAGAAADAVVAKEDVSTPVVPTAEPEALLAASPTPTTAPETRTMDQPGVAKIEELPETYRLALAANYLADTEDESVTERAVQMIEEREEATRGGAGRIPALASFTGGGQKAVDPFQFVLQREEEPRRRPVPKMPVRFAEGGEASSVDAMPDVLANLTESEKQEYLRALIANHLQTQVGPMAVQAVPKNKELEGRISTDVYGVRPYVDVDASGAISEYGAKYGQMGPQGGYEVGVSQAVPIRTGQGKIRMPVVAQGAYSIPVGKMGSVQASGFYVPRQGEMPESAYGANLMYQQRFADGGEVDYNQMAADMAAGQMPAEGQTPAGEVFSNIGRDVVRGSQYLPYDLAGMPVDLATMAMRPLGYNVEKPFLGSEYLIDKAVQAGIADQPTGSTAETAARIGMGFVNPAAVGRQTARGIEAVKDVVTAPIDRAKIQAAASKVPEDVTYDPLRNRLESEGILSLAVKPSGGAVQEYEMTNALSTVAEAELGITGKKLEDILDWVDTKAKVYYQRQYGSPNDPLLRAFQADDFTPSFGDARSDFNSVTRDIARGEIETARNFISSKDPAQQEIGRELLNQVYDSSTPIVAKYGKPTIQNRLNNPRYREEIKQYLGEELNLGPKNLKFETKLAFDKEMDTYFDEFSKTGVLPNKAPFSENDLIKAATENLVDDIANKIQTQKGTFPFSMEKNLAYESKFPDWSASETEMQAVKYGDPVYIIPGKAKESHVDMRDLISYMDRTPSEKWKDTSFPDLVIKAQKDYANITDPKEIYKRIDNYQKVTPTQRLTGATEYMPVESNTLGKGATWRELDENGMKIEGRLLKHCLSEDEKFVRAYKNGSSRFFALRDKEGKSYATIQIDRLGMNEDGPFANVHQIKGWKNDPVGDKYDKEIMDFLNQYQEKELNVPLRFTEKTEFLPKSLGEDLRVRMVEGDSPLLRRYVNFFRRIDRRMTENMDVNPEDLSDFNLVLEDMRNLPTEAEQEAYAVKFLKSFASSYDMSLKGLYQYGGWPTGRLGDAEPVWRNPPVNRAKGGMVDKPLYDRAA